MRTFKIFAALMMVALLLCTSCKDKKHPVTSVSVEPTTKTLTIGDKFTPVATVEPSVATNKKVEWASDKPAIATVNAETGEVTAVSAGDAVITATAKDGSKKSGTVAVTVVPAIIAVTGITLTSATTFEAGTPLTLAATVAPANATNQTIVWSLRAVNSTGATLTNGVLKATAAGTVTVTATIVNGLTATTDFTKDFNITVTVPFVPVTDIFLPASDYSTAVGLPLSLQGTVAPSNATNKTIVWSIKNAG
jgi:uncharacterized protein YjdB